MKLDLDDGSFINFDFPCLRIKAFKRSGKWYASKTTELGADDMWILDRPWDFRDMAMQNDSMVKHLSPLTSGFTRNFYFAVECFLPTHIKGFCTMLIDTEQRETVDGIG